MGTTRITAPTSRVRVGLARADVTPPVGIYHRMWGAARHDRSTGVHRPLYGDVLVAGALESRDLGMVRVYLDGVGLSQTQHQALRETITAAAGVAAGQVVLTYSHTHSGGVFYPDRAPLPGGELIAPYLEELGRKLARACREAIARVAPATITYARGCCNLAANRDYWDETFNGYVCGTNPDAPADDTVLVARIVDETGQVTGTLVNYACHPTTLAWDNTQISPDYVGALRETVERATSAPCIFAQGACGDLGPGHGFVGDVAVADQNGTRLGYAALAALASMGPPASDFHYVGPVISGATVGVWEHRRHAPERQRDTERFGGGSFTIDIPLKPKPEAETLQRHMAEWLAQQEEADARGDTLAARDYGARAERCRRWLGRLPTLPSGSTYPLPYSVFELGDAFWVAVGGEPYSELQTTLRRRFPTRTIVISPLAGGHPAGYLLPHDRFGKGLYQEEPSIPAPGGLEALIDAVSERLSARGAAAG